MRVNTEVLESLLADSALAALRPSLELSYRDPGRAAAMDGFYAQFVRPGDLVFDVGAHVGDRTGSFRRLGARVVAVEPQPLCGRTIRALYGDDDQVVLVAAACGATPGTLELHVNSANPTVSTASPHFVRAADGADGWREEVWDERIDVPSTTLDALVDEHGVPAFVKIDVEGFEDAVLAGLTRPLPALSLEFTTIERAVARRALDRAAALGFTRFNLALGDTMALAEPEWMSADAMATVLDALPHAANSGDVYCRP
ncbi:FkbM family methyltransferase [Micromonospora sp. NPDC126480]|uniref:FkbM family methyltransferase n=1 Tax=Micromonospora sp. NPDC126480 TaxID=3155312 RepID=UPI00331B341A